MKIRDRVKELRRVPAKDLKPHPKNWRTHPPGQRGALRALLEEVGYADALIARETPDGLQLIDGHLRAEVTPNMKVPVLVLDLNDEEAEKVLLTLDPVAAMAEADQKQLRILLDSVEIEREEIKALVKTLDQEAEEPELKPLDMRPPPQFAWFLVGVPIGSVQEVTRFVDMAREIEGSIVESTVSDGPA